MIGLIGCFGVVIVLVSVATGVAVSDILKGSEEKKQNDEKDTNAVTEDFVSNLSEGSMDFAGNYFTHNVPGASSFASFGPAGAAGGGGLFDPLCYTILTESFTGEFK